MIRITSDYILKLFFAQWKYILFADINFEQVFTELFHARWLVSHLLSEDIFFGKEREQRW